MESAMRGMRARVSNAPASAATTERWVPETATICAKPTAFTSSYRPSSSSLLLSPITIARTSAAPRPSNASNTSRAKQRAATTDERGPASSTIVACVNFARAQSPFEAYRENDASENSENVALATTRCRASRRASPSISASPYVANTSRATPFVSITRACTE